MFKAILLFVFFGLIASFAFYYMSPMLAVKQLTTIGGFAVLYNTVVALAGGTFGAFAFGRK